MEKIRSVLEGIKDFVLEIAHYGVVRILMVAFFGVMATLNLQSAKGIVFYIFLTLVVAYLFTDALPPQKLHQKGVVGTTLCATTIGLVLGFALTGPLNTEGLLCATIMCAFISSTGYSLFGLGSDMPASGRAPLAHYVVYALFSLWIVWGLTFIWLSSSLLNDGFVWPLMATDDYLWILKMGSAVGIFWFFGVLVSSTMDAIKAIKEKKANKNT